MQHYLDLWEANGCNQMEWKAEDQQSHDDLELVEEMLKHGEVSPFWERGQEIRSIIPGRWINLLDA